MNILELNHIKHHYNGKKVLDMPGLEIEKGQIYALVGPNGSGKTTLLSIMSLILKPSSGRVIFEGNPVSYDHQSLIKSRNAMTMVLQNPYLFHTSVGKNVAYGLRVRKWAKKERDSRVKEALHLVGLDGFEKRGARQISGGETQLVALARALTLEPRILYLDEPTANVDTRHIHRLERIIERINQKLGTTIVITTHNLSQAYRMTDRVLSLFNGSLVPSTMDNLFSGRALMKDGGAFFDTGKIGIWISPDSKASEATHITIDPEDIIVSKEPFTSSARNLFEGVITKIVRQGGKIVLEVRSEEIFHVWITELSFKEMGLNIGSKIYLTFKASSVHIL